MTRTRRNLLRHLRMVRGLEHVKPKTGKPCRYAYEGCEAAIRNPTVFYRLCLPGGDECQLNINRNGEDRKDVLE